MDEIKDLIKVVTDHTKRNVPLLDLKNQHVNGNKEMNLFLGIKNGDFNDDSSASKGIYGSEDVDFKFRMLKSRLNRKLLNHLFFMDFSSKSFSKSANRYQEALDYLHFSRMLLNVEETNLGTKMLYKTIDLAKESEYTGIVIDGLRTLREVYAHTYRPKLFQNIKSQLEEYEALQRIEEKADAIFQENRLNISSTVNNRKKSFEPYEQAVKELENLYHQTNSYNIFEQKFKMNIWHYELVGDFEKVLELIDEVENMHAKGKLNQLRFDDLFVNLSMGNALIKLRRFEEGILFMERMLNELDQSSKTWFVFAEKLVTLHIQNNQNEMASEIFYRVANNKSFKYLSDKDLLRWNIFRSYLYFLTKDKKIIKKFDYKDFIETTPEFSKEKAGQNVAILILQILRKVNGDLTKLHDKLDALNDYVSKYLNNGFSKRTKTFCKLLQKVAVHNRDINTIISKSKYLQEKLNESEVAGESFVDFEVVPYEFLWKDVLKRLKSSN